MIISLCMIVKNEEEVLERCLSNVAHIFDEIIIVDTGSTDKTKEVAKKFTENIYDFEWINNFAIARNYSFSKAKSKYIMWLDADDVVTDENVKKLEELKRHLSTNDPDCIMLKYAISFDEQNQPTFIYYRERVLKNFSGFVWQDPVHEVITPRGRIKYFDIVIEHRKTKPTTPGRNLKIYEENIKAGLTLSPRQMFYYARELYYNNKIEDATAQFNKFLDEDKGWIENKIEAHLMLSKGYVASGNITLANKSLVNSFLLDLPRAEILCELGNNYILLKQYKQATYWLKIALKSKPNPKSGAFVLLDCYSTKPNLLLTVSYYNLGKIKTAEHYNNKVLAENPENMFAKTNKAFFDNLKASKTK